MQAEYDMGLHVRVRPPKTATATAYVTKYVDYSPIAHRGHADASADGYSPIASLHLHPPPAQTLHSGADHQPDEQHLHSDYVTREMGYSPIDHLNIVDASHDGYSPISALHFPPRGISCAATPQTDNMLPSKLSPALLDASNSPLSGLCKPQMSHFEAVLLSSSQKSSTHGASSSGGAESLLVCDADYSPIARICGGAAPQLVSPCNGTCSTPQRCAACRVWNKMPGASDAADAVRLAREAERSRAVRACPITAQSAPSRVPERGGPLDVAIVIKASDREVRLQVRGRMRVVEAKHKIWGLMGVPPAEQRLLLEASGQLLADERTMDECGVQQGSVVRLQ